MSDVRYALVGLGKMATAVERVAASRGHRRVAGVSRLERARPLRHQVGEPDVVFEFTGPDAAARNVARLIGEGHRVVCGTTGWRPSPELLAAARSSAGAGLIVAANFSVGMAIFRQAVREALRRAASTGLYRPRLQEEHHAEKRDRPSGTALRLAEDVLDCYPDLSGWSLGDDAADERRLPIDVVREGSVPGTHRLLLDGSDDAITFEHRAHGRDGFARGAVLAGEWLAGRTGVHDFERVLEDRGLRRE